MHLILANPPWRQLQERAEKIPGDKKHVEGILSQSPCVAQFNTAQERPKKGTYLMVNNQRYFLQVSLTMVTSVAVRWPCSVESFFMPCSFASALASSFMPCILAFETTPVIVTV